MPNQNGNYTLRELQIQIQVLTQDHPELLDSPVFDGEGNPFNGEIEEDNGDMIIYFTQ